MSLETLSLLAPYWGQWCSGQWGLKKLASCTWSYSSHPPSCRPLREFPVTRQGRQSESKVEDNSQNIYVRSATKRHLTQTEQVWESRRYLYWQAASARRVRDADHLARPGLCRGEGALNLSSTCVWGPGEMSRPEACLHDEPRTRGGPSWHEARAREAKRQRGACHSHGGCRHELCFRGRGTWGKEKEPTTQRRKCHLPGTKRRESSTQVPCRALGCFE